MNSEVAVQRVVLQSRKPAVSALREATARRTNALQHRQITETVPQATETMNRDGKQLAYSQKVSKPEC